MQHARQVETTRSYRLRLPKVHMRTTDVPNLAAIRRNNVEAMTLI